MYTYLLSSLPTLHLTTTPNLTGEAFLAHCESFVSAAELADLTALYPSDRSVSSQDEPKTAAAVDWIAWETQWRNAIARQRAARRRLEVAPYLRSHSGYRVAIAEQVAAAYAKETPLARELALDEVRWRLLDELALADAWGFPALYAYAVKLSLAWRWARLTDESGWGVLETAIKRFEASYG